MAHIPTLLKSNLRKTMVGIFIAGSAIAIYPFINQPEQCTYESTQQQIDASGCIIGADIGSGVLFMLGVAIAILALYVFCLSLLWEKLKRSSPAKRFIVFTTVAIAPFVGLWLFVAA